MGLLLKIGAQVDVAGPDGCGVLHYAALSTQLKSVELLCQARITGIDPYITNDRAGSPLAVLERRIYKLIYEFDLGRCDPPTRRSGRSGNSLLKFTSGTGRTWARTLGLGRISAFKESLESLRFLSPFQGLMVSAAIGGLEIRGSMIAEAKNSLTPKMPGNDSVSTPRRLDTRMKDRGGWGHQGLSRLSISTPALMRRPKDAI